MIDSALFLESQFKTATKKKKNNLSVRGSRSDGRYGAAAVGADRIEEPHMI